MKKVSKLIFLLVISMLFVSCAKNSVKPIDISKEATYYLMGTNGHIKDVNKAMSLYTEACTKGHALSCGMVGRIYEDETFSSNKIPQDLKIAEKWYQRACDMGEQSGCNAVQRVRALSAGDPCHTTFNSYNKHIDYINEHDSRNLGVSKLCKHYKAAIEDGRKIKKICSREIQNIRGLYRSLDSLSGTATHQICRYR